YCSVCYLCFCPTRRSSDLFRSMLCSSFLVASGEANWPDELGPCLGYTWRVHSGSKVALGADPLSAAEYDMRALDGRRHSPEQPRSEEHTSELQSRFDLVFR